MQTISKIEDRIKSFGKPNRRGDLSVQHQVLFIRTEALGEEESIDNNLSDLSDKRLLDLTRAEEFIAVRDDIADCYEQNVSQADDQFFSLNDFLNRYDLLRQNQRLHLPSITDARIEIRPAQVFSQNVYYFVKNKANFDQLEDQFRKLLAESDVPAETVNLTFNCPNSVELKTLYSLMMVLSVVLREAAKDAGFIPGRVIGNFAQITKESF